MRPRIEHKTSFSGIFGCLLKNFCIKLYNIELLSYFMISIMHKYNPKLLKTTKRLFKRLLKGYLRTWLSIKKCLVLIKQLYFPSKLSNISLHRPNVVTFVRIVVPLVILIVNIIIIVVVVVIVFVLIILSVVAYRSFSWGWCSHCPVGPSAHKIVSHLFLWFPSFIRYSNEVMVLLFCDNFVG